LRKEFALDDVLQELLDEAFPASTDAQVIRSVQEGILLADAVISSEGWLRGLMGHDVRGYLRRAGILSRLHDACKAGDLPFPSSMERMPRGPFHWVELSSGRFRAHVCRTEGPGLFPDDTPTRQDERLVNQGDLFTESVVSLRELAETSSELFAWLTFGVHDETHLGHLCWAMPAADGASWLAHTNVLHRLARSRIETETEAPPERVKLKFRGEIEEALNKLNGASEDKKQ
jgi:hypothetical protein